MDLVESCVGELCVIRWCRTYQRENGEDSIVGLYGYRTTFRQIQGKVLKALNFLPSCCISIQYYSE